ncbi:IS110 family transposase [Frankia sp. Cr2]|uniref:IS110 family transposase n=1 Tax=Frankia sp. Cr2 TaxID=3073932 RepID=UPI002AD55A62|nr:transposase [Frankia sp. Cr2]
MGVVGDSETVNVTIVWAGGHQTTGQAARPVARLDQLSYYPQLVARVTELAGRGLSSRQIADQLNTDGLRPPKRTDRFGPGQILTLTRRLGIGIHHPRGTRTALTDLGADRWSVAELAVVLEMPTATIYNWIYRGWIIAERHPDDRSWIIVADDAEIHGTTRTEVLRLLAWLQEHRIEVVVIEATSDYWRSVYYTLQPYLNLMLVNPAHLKGIRGRKTDPSDAAFLARAGASGLVMASFVPAREIRELRDLTRRRTEIVRAVGREAQRLEKELEEKLHEAHLGDQRCHRGHRPRDPHRFARRGTGPQPPGRPRVR